MTSTRGWNLATPVNPLVVVDAADAHDVRQAVRLAGELGLSVAVQNTGHGPHPDLAGSVLISTRRLTELRVHPRRRWARVGAGVRWQAVLDAAAPHGLAPLAGSAPGVGVVGYTTGGGLGPIARSYGLASDRVRAFEVVTGAGTGLRVTAADGADLFWALRGGKGAAGIVTAVELDLLPIAELYAGSLHFDGSDAAAVLACWSSWSDALPPAATTSIAFLRRPGGPASSGPRADPLTVAVRFAWTDDPRRGAEALAPVRRAAAVVSDQVRTMAYRDLGRIHADRVDPAPVRQHHGLVRELGPRAQRSLLDRVGPGSDCPQVMVELRQLGGAIAARPRVESAVCHRDAAFSLTTVGPAVPGVLAQVDRHGAGLMDDLAPWLTGGQLPNFNSSTDAAGTARSYTPATVSRLKQVVARHDPRHVILRPPRSA